MTEKHTPQTGTIPPELEGRFDQLTDQLNGFEARRILGIPLVDASTEFVPVPEATPEPRPAPADRRNSRANRNRKKDGTADLRHFTHREQRSSDQAPAHEHRNTATEWASPSEYRRNAIPEENGIETDTGQQTFKLD